LELWELLDGRVVQGFDFVVDGFETGQGFRGRPVFCFAPRGLEPFIDKIADIVGNGLNALDGAFIGRAGRDAIAVDGRTLGDGCVEAVGRHAEFESAGDGIEGGVDFADVGGAFAVDRVLGLEKLAGLEDVEVEGAGG